MKTLPTRFSDGRPRLRRGSDLSTWLALVALLGLVGDPGAWSAVGAPTPLNGSQSGTLPLANSPYLATADLYVGGGQTLTIESGVVIQFQNPDTALVVDGTLVARGTAAAPILFTSDDAQKAPGQWEAIIFRGANTNSILENCIVEYGAAKNVSDESIRLESASPTLRNCTISNSRMHGVTLLFADPLIENCRFVNNGSTNQDAFAIFMRSDCLPRLSNNTAAGNVHDAVGIFDYNVSRKGTWVKDNLPYTLINDIYVNSGATLTLAPGVVVQLRNPDTALVVDGTLVAVGTGAAPILFTSDEVQKAPGQWEAIIFRGPNTNSILENCVVEGGAASGVCDETIRLEGAAPTLRNCTVRNSRVHGLTLLNSDPLIENCQFLNNGSTNTKAFAIAMRIDSLPRLRNNTASANGHDAIAVFDYNFGRTGTWVKDNFPYTLLNDVFILNKTKLTLEPGVTVQFQEPDTALIVDGTLTAQGTTNAPIRFTSDEVQKVPGQWEAIIFRATNTNSILENCVVEYGGAAGLSDEIIRFEDATATIRNCTIRNSRKDGMRFQFSDPVIENCLFLNNGTTNKGFAMTMRIDSLPRLKNNTAQGNGRDAIAVFDYNFGRNGTWLKDNFPYTLVNDVYVLNRSKLTIQPGVTIQFQDPDDALIVDGTLIAQGTANAPIRFTSDDIQKTPGQWEAIIFRRTNTNSILENCIVEYGAAVGLSDEIIRFEDTTATIRSCAIRNSRKDGMRFQFSDPVIENCQFVNNGTTNNGFAMTLRSDAFPKLKNNIASGNGRDAIAVFGSSFNRTGVWPRDGLPYTIVEDIYINTGKELRIETGVVVQFQDPDDALIVDGTLRAQGVRFTSDDAAKKPGQWESIYFRDTADDAASELEDCQIEYGGANAEGQLAFYSASPRVLRCIITQSVSDGIHANNASPSVQYCRITQNGRDGVRTVNQSNLSVNNSTVAGNKEFGARNFDTARIINAKFNFWGDPSGPLDNSDADGRGQTNPNGKGDKVSEYVDWSSHLLADLLPPTLPQKIEVTPSSLDFGVVTVSQSRELVVAVRNTGGLDLTVSSVASDNTQFQVASPVTPFTVAAGLQQLIRVTFNPNGTAAAAGTLTVRCDDPGQPSVGVPFRGSGVITGECSPSPAGLVGWWPGDGTFFNQIAANHGQALGAVGFAGGEVGQAFSFAKDGDGVTVPHDSMFDVQAPGFTAEFWTRGGKNQPQNMFLVVDKSHGWVDSTGWMFQGYSDSGKLQFGIGSGGGGSLNYAVVLSTVDLLDGVYHHVAGSWDGSTVRLYVDQVLQGEAALSAPVSNTRPVNLGYSWGGGSANRFFRGQVDELSIYRRALTAGEVQLIYNTGSAGKCRQTVAAPVIGLVPASLDFGSVSLGQTKDLALAVRNSGAAALTVNSIVSDNTRFAIISPAMPFNVSAGAQQVVLVRFSPASTGVQTGLLSINSNDPAQAKVTIPVSGNGIAPPPTTCSVAPADLLGWWPGEGSAGDLRTNRPGVIYGATFAPGLVGQAFQFDGVDDYVDLGPWNAGSAWTVEAWVKPSSLPSGRRTIVGGVSDCLDWGIAMQDRQFGVVIRQPGGCTDTVRSVVTAAVADTWYHVAGTCDGVTATIYVNGEPRGAAPVERNYVGTSSGARIGGEVCCGGNNFPGLIDEASIYTRALGASEIQAIAAAGSAGKCRQATPVVPPRLTAARANNQIVLSWPAGASNIKIQATASLHAPIQWSTLTNTTVLVSGQNTVTLPMDLSADAPMFFRALLDGAMPIPSDGGQPSSSLASSVEVVSAALAALNQISSAGTGQEFQARVNQQLAALQNAWDALNATLDGVAAQADAAATNSGLSLASTASAGESDVALMSLPDARLQNAGFVPGPLTDVINQFKQVKQTVDDLKQLKKKFTDASDLLNLLAQNKSLDEIASARSGFFKQISDVFKKMREEVEAPLAEMIDGKNRQKQDDVDDFNALVAFVSASDPVLGGRLGSPQFTIDSYRNLNLTDQQKNLVAQAFRSSTIRGRLYLRDNLLGFLNTLASAGVETYVSTIIDATGGKGVKDAVDFAKKVYGFLTATSGAATPESRMQFSGRRRFLNVADSASEVKADLFLLAKLPDGNTRLAMFLIEGKKVINEKGEWLSLQGLPLPPLAYDVLVVPRDQENAPIKLMPLATTLNANLTTFVDLPLVHATKVTVNLAAKQRDAAGGLTDAVLALDQKKALTVRVEGFPQTADGPMGAVFDTELQPDGTTRGFFVIPFLPPNLPLTSRITGPDTEDFQENLTVTQAESQMPVTLILKALPSSSWLAPVISWKLSNSTGDLVITNAVGPTFSNTVAGVLYSAQGHTNVNTTITGTLQVTPLVSHQEFEVIYTLTRQVQSPMPGVKSFSSISLSTTQSIWPVSSGVVATNPETIWLKLTFRPIPQTSLYKIDLTASPGFTGFGPGVTFFAADTFGGYGGNFSMFGDNSGVSFGNGKISFAGTVSVGSDLSSFNPAYRLDVKVTFRSP